MNTQHIKYDQAHNLYFQTALTQTEIARFEESQAAKQEETTPTQSPISHQPDINIPHSQPEKQSQTAEHQSLAQPITTIQNVDNKKPPQPDIPQATQTPPPSHHGIFIFKNKNPHQY